MLKYILMWPALLVAAFVNAAIREAVYASMTGTVWAHRISVFTGIVLTGVVAWSMLSKRPPLSSRDSILGGITWLVMTEIFEFSMIVLYSKKSVAFFLGVHNIAAGELWPVFLLWITMFPFLFYKLKHRG